MSGKRERRAQHARELQDTARLTETRVTREIFHRLTGRWPNTARTQGRMTTDEMLRQLDAYTPTTDPRADKLQARTDQIAQDLDNLIQRLQPQTPPPPRQVTNPVHVYALPRGSLLQDADARVWLVTEIVNPPDSGSHDPICVRLDANPRNVRPASQLTGPDRPPLTVLRTGIDPTTTT